VWDGASVIEYEGYDGIEYKTADVITHWSEMPKKPNIVWTWENGYHVE
jgi:hypothetical protein